MKTIIARALEALAYAAAVALLLVTLGCASIEPVKIPEKASVATAIACLDAAAIAELERACPRLRSDAEILALDDYQVVVALRSDRAKAQICIQKLQAAAASCSKVPVVVSPPPPLSDRRE